MLGIWVGPDGESVLAGLNPGSYSGGIDSDLSKPLPAEPPDTALTDAKNKMHDLRSRLEKAYMAGDELQQKDIQEYVGHAAARSTRSRRLTRTRNRIASRVTGRRACKTTER